jgi:tripartite-type tricarboxylate transporter receptor subunit TctC
MFEVLIKGGYHDPRAKTWTGSWMSMRWLALGAALAAAAITGYARAQEYPSRPVRIIVGFSAGGGTDVMARLGAQSMTKRMGQD